MVRCTTKAVCRCCSVQIATRWAHDAVRRRDRVYVASTGDGHLLELAFPNMTQVGAGGRVFWQGLISQALPVCGLADAV
jgi:hypothetical protein